MDNKFDVVVIGGGPAGYVAAIRSAQNGLSTACIDAWENPGGPPAFGGTCLNAGCIPSKALLESSELYHRACNELGNHGIKIADVSLDLDAMQERKITIVQQLTDGIHSLFEANGVRGLHGRGQLLPNNQVQFTSHGGDTELIEGQNIILATGSTPVELPSIPFDGKQIVDSWGALEFDKVPQRLGVIGAGVIGLELGSVWNRLGSSVAIVEALDQFLPMVDGQIAREAQRQFKRQGLDIRLGA
ncbi:MAG: FAD-dependent oxidoreductase, partial [Gammaproteobacteria bacterium]